MGEKMIRKKVLVSVILAALLLAAPTGAAPVLRLSDMADILPEWPVTSSEAGGKFIFSDSPEIVEYEGILYQDKVQGDVRLFFHHVNGMSEQKRIVVMIVNHGKVSAKVDVLRYGVSKPDHDFLRAGRSIQADYLKGSRQHKMELLPGKSALLPTEVTANLVNPGAILTGMMDFRSDKEVRLVVAAVPVEFNSALFLAQAPVLPPGRPHLRGTFAHADRVLLAKNTYDPGRDGPVAITMGDGIIDSFLAGSDVTNGLAVKNEGNYGVIYRVLIPTSGQGKIRCYLNPRGGVYAGWVAVKTKLEHKLVGIPSKSIAFGAGTLADFELIAEFDAGDSIWVTLSPPGASNLPVRLMLIPAL